MTLIYSSLERWNRTPYLVEAPEQEHILRKCSSAFRSFQSVLGLSACILLLLYSQLWYNRTPSPCVPDRAISELGIPFSPFGPAGVWQVFNRQSKINAMLVGMAEFLCLEKCYQKREKSQEPLLKLGNVWYELEMPWYWVIMCLIFYEWAGAHSSFSLQSESFQLSCVFYLNIQRLYYILHEKAFSNNMFLLWLKESAQVLAF